MPLTKGEDFNRVTGLRDQTGHVQQIIGVAPKRARYFYRLRDDRLTEFCVENACGPQSVETIARDGQHRKWQSYWEGDLLVFYPPDGADISEGVFWAYDKRLQIAVEYPRAELERKALGMRASILVPRIPA